MESTTTTETLQKDLYPGGPSDTELLYKRYGGMLFSFILQFEADRPRAAGLLEDIIIQLNYRMEEAWRSGLSLYCWLQREARKIILADGRGKAPGSVDTYYYSLLKDASADHQWVFRELYIYGRRQDELAVESNKDIEHITGLLREALLIIRKNLV